MKKEKLTRKQRFDKFRIYLSSVHYQMQKHFLQGAYHSAKLAYEKIDWSELRELKQEMQDWKMSLQNNNFHNAPIYRKVFECDAILGLAPIYIVPVSQFNKPRVLEAFDAFMKASEHIEFPPMMVKKK